MRSEMVTANGLEFHCLTAGDPAAPLMLLLHGFPEYSGAWEEMLSRLSGDFFLVAPDQRGYGQSSKPDGVASYTGGKLAADIAALIEHYRPGGAAAAVFGHDWGASAAYAAAIRTPEKIERLIIANGVHPIPFQRAMAAGGDQSAASQYIDWLRVEGSEDRLAADAFAKMETLFGATMDMSWLTPDRRAKYLEAWGRPGAMRAMVNWYRATPLKVAKPGQPIAPADLPAMPADAMRITMPHLLLWGLDDSALRPASREGLADLCDDLTVVDIPGADHWILHQQPDAVAAEVERFMGV
jgi:pimeloyl-ACP methyl ester carboxylesterase